MTRRLLKQSVLTGAGDSCSASESTAGWISKLFAGERGQPQLHCRAIDSGSQAGMPDGLLSGMLGGASVDKSLLMEGSLDASLMGHFGEMVKPPSLEAREIDPMLLGVDSLALPKIPEDAGVVLARRPEIEAVHGRLGAGTFGEVFHCTLKGSEQEVAVKVLHKGSDISQKREVELLGQFKHDNLVQFICLLHGPPDALVLELCAGGCLTDVLHGPMAQPAGVANLGLQPRARAVLDVVVACEYLHSQRIVHRDIKPGNVFLTSTVSTPMIDLPPVKLGDLGLARELDNQMTKCTGTWRYMAPEVLTSNSYTETADVYSCGLLLHEVMSGKVPFDGLNVIRVVQAVTTGQRPDPKDINGPSPIIDVLGEVLDACWAEEPTDRPSASYLAQCIKPVAKVV
mmetsp:Transcript_17969/g.51049  ORF Transcript_17969/g.51049 Transcript_17969/m.51049 type:complete len:399 (-) Transcript_17969:346-1542(-)